MAATIYKIAELCGTSHMTVSRALNDSPQVNVKTKQRILQAAKELGYRPKQSAAALRRGKTNSISVILPDLANPFYVEFARAIEQDMATNDYNVEVMEYGWDASRERAAIEQVLERRHDGAIAFINRFEPLHDLIEEAWQKHVPFVVPGLPPDIGTATLDGTTMNIGTGIEQAVEHLVALGHRRIMYVGSWGDRSGVGPERLQAIRRAFDRHGLPCDDASVFVQCTGRQLEDGYDVGLQIAMQNKDVTAVIGVNDYLLVGLMKALAEHDWRVPQDISLVGADDTWISRYWPVSLTTIDLHTRAHAQAAVKILMKRLGTTHWRKPLRKHLDTSLIVRDSTGAVTKQQQVPGNRDSLDSDNRIAQANEAFRTRCRR